MLRINDVQRVAAGAVVALQRETLERADDPDLATFQRDAEDAARARVREEDGPVLVDVDDRPEVDPFKVPTAAVDVQVLAKKKGGHFVTEITVSVRHPTYGNIQT